ncbi:MAG: VOC family protein [Xanthomonadales bacterium]|jgi:hypothetical protein|nr:VOC family protein [Xanthomonadales bacterium]
MQHDVIEQVQFRARDSQADQQMAEAAWAAQAVIEQLPGYLSRQFGRAEDGGWVDLVRWQSLAHAQAAAATAGQHPVIAAFFALIDLHSVQMRHYRAHAPAGLWDQPAPPRRATLCLSLAAFGPTRDFHEQYFGARVRFESATYLVLQLGGPLAPELHLMQPMPAQPVFGGQGLMLNLELDEVDALYARMADADVPIRMPLEDHPWGDRAFSCVDPAGLELYCYSPRPLAAAHATAVRWPWSAG